MGNGLSGISSVAYQGTNAATPPNITTHHNRPTPNFYQNFQIGDFWVYIPLPPGNNNELWVLMGVAANIANWVLIGGGTGVLLSLTGNSGGAVFPLLGNINVVGDGTTIDIVGDPATHTLTVTALDTGTVNTLTGNTGGAVGPSAGNINVVGDGTTITIVGDPLTNTLTASVIGGEGANSFPTDNGTATPAAGVLNIIANVAALNCGSSVEFTAPGTSNTVQLNVTDSLGNTIIGSTSGNATLTSTGSVGLGDGVLTSLTSATNCIAIGNGSGSTLTSGSTNLLIGNGAGSALSGTSENNLIIGGDTGFSGATAYMSIGVNAPNNPTIIHNYPGQNASTANGGNVFIGFSAGNLTLAGATEAGNNVLGGGSLQDLTSGFANNTMGCFSLRKLTSGNANLALGAGAGYDSVGDTGLTTGHGNILIGYTAANAYTSSESGNIIIGDTPGVTGESNVLRIGFGGAAGAGSITTTFIDGIRGVTTVNNNAVAVLVDSAGQLGTVSSSIRYKENVRDMADSSTPLMKLRPVTFNYKAQGNKDYGLIAEEVAEIFPDLVVYNDDGEPETIKYHILCSILLNEVQKLSKRIESLESQASSS